jgi:hypothetical protein
VSLTGSNKVDFVAYSGNKSAIGDAKDKARLTFLDVEKLIEDAGSIKRDGHISSSPLILAFPVASGNTPMIMRLK